MSTRSCSSSSVYFLHIASRNLFTKRKPRGVKRYENKIRCVNDSSVIVDSGLVLRRGEKEAWDFGLIGNPVVSCFVGDNEQRWSMYYTGTDQVTTSPDLPLTGITGLVTSSDGLHWVRPNIERDKDDGLNIVLRENQEEWWAFDTSSISVSDVQIMFSPNVNAGQEGVYWMYYSGCNNEPTSADENRRKTIMRAGLAMSQNGFYWARIEGSNTCAAVLDIGEEGEWDHSFIGRPQVLNCGTRDLRMYYHSYDQQDQIYKIGLAQSSDGLKWEKKGVCFAGSEKYKFDAKGASSQSVVYDLDNKQFLMFYEAVCDSEERSICLAISKDGFKDWHAYNKPIITVAERGCWDDGAIGTPWAVSMDRGRWRVYYSGTSKNFPSWEGIGVCLSDPSGPEFYGVPTKYVRNKLT